MVQTIRWRVVTERTTESGEGRAKQALSTSPRYLGYYSSLCPYGESLLPRNSSSPAVHGDFSGTYCTCQSSAPAISCNAAPCSRGAAAAHVKVVLRLSHSPPSSFSTELKQPQEPVHTAIQPLEFTLATARSSRPGH